MKYGYHAYTDGKDGYFDTLIEALALVIEWLKAGYSNIRVDEIGISCKDGDYDEEPTNVLYYGDFPL